MPGVISRFPSDRSAGDDFWHEIWIDGRVLKRTHFMEPPDPRWDQIQIWITADDYTSEMKGLGRGTHEVVIWVMKNTYELARNDAGGEDATECIGLPVRLAKGVFTYVVPR